MKLGKILHVFKYYRWDLRGIYRFIKYNFFSSHIRSKGGYFYPSSNIELSFASGAVIELYGSFKVGVPITSCSKTLSRLIMKPYSRIVVNEKLEILEGCDIQIYDNASLYVDNFHSNINLEITCGYLIRLLGTVTAGRHVRIKDFNGHEVSYKGYPYKKEVIAENHTWLCTGSTINPGVFIASGSVVADNANVVESIPPVSLVQGNPAQVVASEITFKI